MEKKETKQNETNRKRGIVGKGNDEKRELKQYERIFESARTIINYVNGKIIHEIKSDFF